MKNAREIAAQLWTLDRHAKKEMDSEFCEDIAKELTKAYRAGVEAAGKLCSGKDPKIAHSAWCAAIKDENGSRIDCHPKCAHVVLMEFALAGGREG